MKVSGTALAQTILRDLKPTVNNCITKPHLAVVLATNNPAPHMYVSIKSRRAQEIGVTLSKYEYTSVEQEQCIKTINDLNANPNIHGILIQLPMYENWNSEEYVNAVSPNKDVDGFLPNSRFKPATGLAVWEMLTEFAKLEQYPSAYDFLKDKNIVILGKGKTAGKPAADLLRENKLNPTIIDTKTINPTELIAVADVIISATGRKHIIKGSSIKEGAYVIGIGVGKETIDGEEKIYGDIEETEIDQKTKLWCPTIGGIGPLTIACLLRNTVNAATNNR